jgi:hypothetical protein
MNNKFELRVQLKEKTINIALETLGGNFFGTKFCYEYDSYYEVNERLLEN